MSAKSVAESFLKRTSGLVQTRSQLIDANQLSKLACTLGNKIRQDIDCEQLPPDGTPVPPGWHLVYFTPSLQENSLGKDGSDRSYSPHPPFTRRMWAGGRLQWRHGEGKNLLRINERVAEHTRVFKAEPKKNKVGQEMIVAGLKKYYETENGIALTDEREWVFRPELPVPADQDGTINVPAPAAISKPYETSSKIIASSRHQQSAISLFRFSALTFNAHKIHYSLPWTRQVEGHPNVVVHAPLNLILMLELYRQATSKMPNSMEYRAVSPIYADEPYTIKLAESGEIWCEKDSTGGVCLTGRID